jgi:hypothetical protein
VDFKEIGSEGLGLDSSGSLYGEMGKCKPFLFHKRREILRKFGRRSVAEFVP